MKILRFLSLLSFALALAVVFSPNIAKAQGEINVRGPNGVKISDGDLVAAVADGTFFGVVVLGDGQSLTRTFTVENTDGLYFLNLEGNPAVRIGGEHPNDFSVTKIPSTAITPGFSTTFEVTFDPTAGGIRNATITIPNSDSNEDSYKFAIQATVRLALKYNAGSGGTISGSSSQTPYYSQDGSAVTAVPKAGYHFLKWTDGSTQNPRTERNVIENLSVTAKFLRYTVADGEVTITRFDPDMDGNINIPDSIDGLPVTAIADGAGEGCTELLSVSIPASVASIGSQAFVGCTSLQVFHVNPTSAHFSSQLNVLFDDDEELVAAPSISGHYSVPVGTTSIGAYAFANRSDLTSISIPAGVSNIGDYAFVDCEGLTSISIPEGVLSIGDYAFSGCSGLETVSLPTTLASLGGHAFTHCSRLSGISIPAGLASIGEHAFSHCGSLTDVTIGAGITGIGDYAFSECVLLNGIVIPSGVTRIGEHAFSGCDDLASVAIPAGVIAIGGSAFRDCNRLADISVPDGVARIEDYTFVGCHELASVSLGNGITSIGDYAFFECRILKEMTIPNGVVRIGKYAFYGCWNLMSIDLPETLNSIGISAFDNCALKSVAIPEGITSIPAGLFSSCEELETVMIPESVTSIGAGAFSNCKSLTTVTIPDGVTAIERRTFFNCLMLESINIPEGVTTIGVQAFCCSALKHAIIPEGVTRIDWRAFGYCWRLESVTIPSTVTAIAATPSPPPGYYSGEESQAFISCPSLTTVTIPQNVATIGWWAFKDCANLTSIIFEGDAPEALSRFGVSPFAGISPDAMVLHREDATGFDGSFLGLRAHWFDYTINLGLFGSDVTITDFDQEATGSLFLPDSVGGLPVSRIGFRALLQCNGLTSVDVPPGVSSIEGEAFGLCNSLASVTIPSSVSNIGNAAFYGCDSLTSFSVDPANPRFSVDGAILFNQDQTELLAYPTASGDYTVPTGVAKIGDSAFFLCNDLTSVAIPEGVTHIGFSAFRDCSTLARVVMPGTITSIGDRAFDGCVALTDITIPQGITSIGAKVFAWCFSLTEVTLPERLTTIGAEAFVYTDLSGITIPASVTSIGDGAFVAARNLQDIVIEGDAPTLGADVFSSVATGATVSVADPSAAGFRYGGTFGGLPITGLGPNADPYGTGVPNLLTYAFFGPDRDPATVSQSELPKIAPADGSLRMTFTQAANVSGVVYGAEWSSTLDNDWQDLPDADADPDTYEFSVPIEDGKKFMRLKVSEL